MAEKDTTHRFPYQHLAVLGVEKMKKYVPPPPIASETRASAPRLDSASKPSTNGAK